MNIVQTPKISLNPAYLKQKPLRADIDRFKNNLKKLIDSTNDSESEEFHKNLLSDFLKSTYYSPNHSINTKGRNDLVIHNGNSASSSVGVLIEAKKPTNKAEMPSVNNLNSKALQELVLYYLRERITDNNLEVKHLIITNISEWFIFDATVFEDLFAKNKALVKQFKDFEEGRLSGTNTDYFYSNIAKPFVDSIEKDITFTHFVLEDYVTPLTNDNLKDDKELIALYKLLSPEHLLKLPFANDSNTLNENFYKELLHLIGLTRVKDKGKELIDRHKEGERNPASLLENTITQLDDLDKLSRLDNPSQYGENRAERLFNVALELCITWVNRILFLKLLEAQLITYHKGNKDYEFLNNKKIKNYDDLNSLFFQVLAKLQNERNQDVRDTFAYVPYLNSSLFEPTEIEHNALFISNLKDNKQLPILPSTVLKDSNGKKLTGTKSTLEYIFDFLNSYDFSSEGSEDIQEENKTLINASVLGLIFEKINGYKDGSFFTPGFITEYMCHETIRRAVVQKFNEVINETTTPLHSVQHPSTMCYAESVRRGGLKSLKDVYDIIDENGSITRQKANEIINSITICDPAVGSGHFLVSALNEILAIKNDLRILQDRNGDRLKEYTVSVINDELIITDENNSPFKYNYNNPESQRVQEAIFHEKQTIIENCLFGVDINPNSVKICRLRLWIELLKHAYYKNETELETLPNIDINIKCGNSLISLGYTNENIKTLNIIKNRDNIKIYKVLINTYKEYNKYNPGQWNSKLELKKSIEEIKSKIKPPTVALTKKQIKLRNTIDEYNKKISSNTIFPTEILKIQKELIRQKYDPLIVKLQKEVDEELELYNNAIDWRIEFPEILDDEGNFLGFDVVIGNPPYFAISKLKEFYNLLADMDYFTFEKTTDIYCIFFERSIALLKENGYLSFITSNKWMRAGYGKNLRHFFSQLDPQLLIDLGPEIFTNATVDTNLIMIKNKKVDEHNMLTYTITDYEEALDMSELEFSTMKELNSDSWVIMSKEERSIISKIEAVGKPLKEWDISINRGILTGFNEAFIIDGTTKERLIAEDSRSEEILKPILRGRDIKRYNAHFADLWLITTHNGYNSKDGEIERISIEEFPAIKKHLDQYWESLEKRYDKGSTPYNLRNCAYINDFQKEKIAWPSVGETYFSFIEKNTLLLDTNYFFSIDNLNLAIYILGVINSRLIVNHLNNKDTKVGTLAYRHYKPNFLSLEIIEFTNNFEQNKIIDLVNQILAAKKEDPEADTQELEDEIDYLVYKLYDLTYDEVLIVDPDTKIGREEYGG